MTTKRKLLSLIPLSLWPFKAKAAATPKSPVCSVRRYSFAQEQIESLARFYLKNNRSVTKTLIGATAPGTQYWPEQPPFFRIELILQCLDRFEGKWPYDCFPDEWWKPILEAPQIPPAWRHCETPLFDGRDIGAVMAEHGPETVMSQVIRYVEIAVQAATGRDDIHISYRNIRSEHLNPHGQLGCFSVTAGAPQNEGRGMPPLTPFPRHMAVSIRKPDGSRDYKVLTGKDCDDYCLENGIPIRE